MRLVHRTSAEQNSDDAEHTSLCRSRRFVVRRSIVGRLFLLAVVIFGATGYLVGPAKEATEEGLPGRTALRGHENLVDDLTFDHDGRTLLTSGWDRHVRMWNLQSEGGGWGKELGDIPHDWHVFAIATTPDGKYLAAAGLRGFTVWKRSEQAGWEMVSQQTGTGRRCVAASPDCRTLALGGLDGTVRLWDIATREETYVSQELSADVKGIQFSPDGRFLAATTFSGEFRIWELRPGSEALPIKHHIDSVQAFRFARDNRTVAIARWGDQSKDLILWDYRSGMEDLRLGPNVSGINDLAVSPDGRILASADRDRSIRFWDMRTGQLKATIVDGVGWVKTLAYAPDGRRIAFGGQSGVVQVLNLDQRSVPDVVGRTGKMG